MPKFNLTIGGTQIPQYCTILPAKYDEHIDEQLDLASASVYGVKTEMYEPFSPVTLEIEGKPDDGETTITKHYRLMSDRSEESPNGSGFYRHELLLIEETKYLEGFMVESLCVTNAGGRNYVQIPVTVETKQGDEHVNFVSIDGVMTPQATSLKIKLPDIVPVNVSTIPGITDFEQTIKISFFNAGASPTEKIIVNETSTTPTGNVSAMVDIYSGVNTFTYEYTFQYIARGQPYKFVERSNFSVLGQPNRYPLKPWTYKEVINRALELVEPLVWDESATREETQETSMMVTVSGNPPSFSNTGSISRGKITSAVITNSEVFLQYRIRISISHTDTTYTVTASAPSGTINPILAAEIELTVEQAGNYVVPPRFKFRYMDESDAHEIAIFDGLAPEFTFTRCTLRELLQTIGGAIHREPRLDENNAIYFVPLGGTERAIYRNRKDNYNIKELRLYPYMKKTSTWELEQACTRLDSYVDNLVNQISLGDATVGQPYTNGAQSLRTDSSYIRVNEESGIFPTVFPILKINRFSWVDIGNIAGGGVKKYDITAFLFEKSVYDSQLSSYTTAYPVSKAFGLYYTQGQKNIGGLFFENTEWSSGVFAQPAIVNILRAVTGNDNLLSGAGADDYAKLCFELVYTPIYSARVQHGKQYLGDYLVSPRTMAHNQSANQVEAQYYGENIKGMAQRLGNVEKAYTFFCEYASTIPTAGQMWDDDYCISDVAVELLADYFKVTVGLTKNFNRKSKYIGANSYRRIYEISERMVQERQSIYTDYLVIAPYATPSPQSKNNCFCNNSRFFLYLESAFLQGSGGATPYEKITSIIYQGQTKTGGETLSKVILPVIASAFGNVMEFSWEFKDNFSAGQRIVYQSNDGPEGYFTTEVQYCDYYGRIYYETWQLCTTYRNATSPQEFPLYGDPAPLDRPQEVIEMPANCTIVKRKDSREALKGNYSIEAVSDIKGLIIGSAFASNNPLVVGPNPSAKAIFVILNKPINKFSRKVNLSTENVAATYQLPAASFITTVSKGTYALAFSGISVTVPGAAWAIITPTYTGEPYTVEDEDGNVETITPTYGGELLIGKNMNISSGDTIGAFKIFPTHDVFSYMKQKEEQEA